jgi:hypothetical protein
MLSVMTSCVRALVTVASLVVPLSALAGDPSASIPASPAGRWEGTATEVPGIYSGPVSAKVTLHLAPDGTFTETWKEGARTRTISGTWRERGNRVVLESSDPSRARQTLRRKGDALYTVAMEPMPSGRATTTSIELRPAAS